MIVARLRLLSLLLAVAPLSGYGFHGALPCPTCPGGRAGPGGAYAFPRPAAESGLSGAAASLRGGPQLRLMREPERLSAMAARNDDLGVRADRIPARMTWPEKPGQGKKPPPLTAEEQERFDAGGEIYRNICQACHQADGRGREKLAPSLVGSSFALAAAGIPIRILLHGKQGTVGLMPPVGGTLNDEQIASVLTYVRREWGQSGTAVDPAAVKSIRAQTSARTKPWQDDELQALMHKSK